MIMKAINRLRAWHRRQVDDDPAPLAYETEWKVAHALVGAVLAILVAVILGPML